MEKTKKRERNRVHMHSREQIEFDHLECTRAYLNTSHISSKNAIFTSYFPFQKLGLSYNPGQLEHCRLSIIQHCFHVVACSRPYA